MYKDPIVAEVRKAREEMAKDADYDLDTFLTRLRAAQDNYADRLTDLGKRKKRSDNL